MRNDNYKLWNRAECVEFIIYYNPEILESKEGMIELAKESGKALITRIEDIKEYYRTNHGQEI